MLNRNTSFLFHCWMSTLILNNRLNHRRYCQWNSELFTNNGHHLATIIKSRYLKRATTEWIVNALITSRLDYCNSLLFGTSANNINRLQRLQNSVARLVTRQSRHDSAMPLLRELHWLPVRHRVSYKIAELTFKALHVDLSPTYLQQCVQVYTPARSLRSASSYTLVQNKSRTTCLRYLQRITAIIQSSPEDSLLCIGIHVTTSWTIIIIIIITLFKHQNPK